MNIKTFEQACKAKKINPRSLRSKLTILQTVLLFFFPKKKKHIKAVIAFTKLIIIAEVLNDGWKPSWKDNNQPKWYAWFWMDSSTGFRCYGAAFGYSHSNVGSRLCFRDEANAEFAGKQFKSLYKDLMVL
ncbi:MAG TPA: hypothetical protein VMZ03_04015 [Chitinophagaceae bacterium]|nr:hypothetical protein [Chitinophagaceae bacterium]